MRRQAMSVLLLGALGALGFLAAGIALGANRSSATVSLHTTKLGPVLVSSTGRTLYLFAKDAGSRSSCSGSCATYWPPLLVRGKPTAGAGVKASLLGTAKRSNGRLQVTYNRHPLYTYALDKRAGQTSGEGSLAFGARWWAVSARGTAVTKPVSTTTSPTTTEPPTTYAPYP